MRVTISAAPSPSRTLARSALPTTAVTLAPERAASCTARLPTPPAAPVISTRLPSSGAPWRRVRSAVRPATGSEAASANDTSSGSAAMRWLGTAACSAQPSQSVRQTTRVPAGGPLPSAAWCTTMPAISWPGRQPSGRTWNSRISPRLSENARTATSASLAAGSGSGASLIATVAAPPGVLTTASMAFLLTLYRKRERGRAQRGG